MSEENTNWFDRPIIGKYSTIDFARTGLALMFIASCIVFITIYIHRAVEEQRDDIIVEYVNMTRADVYDEDNNLILKAPDLVVDRILEFPISYDKLDIQGYILIDSATGVKYLYIRNTFGISMSKYWTKSEFESIGGDPNHHFLDLYKNRPSKVSE